MRRLIALFSALLMFASPSLALADDHADHTHQTADKLPPLYAAEIGRAKAFVGNMMADGVVVPVPKDPGGGYTHEQHKRNFRAIYLGGQLFKITGDEVYRDYARDLLLAYAEMYPTLG